MAGIYGIVSANKPISKNQFQHFHSYNSTNIINEEFETENLLFGRSVLNKFNNDRVLSDLVNYAIGIEGVLYNNKNGLSTEEFIIKAYKRDGISFLKKLKGQFSGFIFDKRLQKLFVFTDNVSSKAMYYHQGRDGLFCFSSEAKLISSLLIELKLSPTLNHDAYKSLLTFGYLLDDNTPINEAKKLPYASFIELDIPSNKLTQERYFSYTLNTSSSKKSDLIEQVDSLICEAVTQEWEKDAEYNYPHFSFISGGLDSRVNLMLADELGYKTDLGLTFSDPNSTDHIIANKIAKDLGFKHSYVPLNGDYLLNDMYQNISANDGVATLIGASHAISSLEKFNLANYGLAHSGQIGDVLFGSYSNKPPISLSTIGNYGFVNDSEIIQSISFIDELIKRYDFEQGAEMFSYEQRQFNGTLNGDRMMTHLIDSASPFYDRELLQFCLNIPKELKKGQRIYLDWFNNKHPKIANFQWQKTGVKPSSFLKTEVAFFKKRVINKVYSKLGKQYDNMNPFIVWFKENPKLPAFYTKLFNRHIHLIEDNELKAMTIKIFTQGDPVSMMNAVSALLTANLFLKK